MSDKLKDALASACTAVLIVALLVVLMFTVSRIAESDLERRVAALEARDK